jgi:hypothetical protein
LDRHSSLQIQMLDRHMVDHIQFQSLLLHDFIIIIRYFHLMLISCSHTIYSIRYDDHFYYLIVRSTIKVINPGRRRFRSSDDELIS